MSAINCDSCANLREYAPEFVQNGVTDNIAASLKNNTGFNAALTVLRDNCTDLNDANDCLIGRMTDELPAYDVCDWKEFMSNLLPNQYEVLKAIIASACGQWTKIEQLCTSVDNILGLNTTPLKNHIGTWVPEVYDLLTTVFDKQLYVPMLSADIVPGAGCSEDVALGRIGWGVHFIGDVGSRNPDWALPGIQLGTVLAYWRKADIVPKYMTENQWETLMYGRNQFAWCIPAHYEIGTKFRGYIRAGDGYEYNTDLKSRFGEDVLTVCVSTAVGTTDTTLTAGGQILNNMQTYIVKAYQPTE